MRKTSASACFRAIVGLRFRRVRRRLQPQRHHDLLGTAVHIGALGAHTLPFAYVGGSVVITEAFDPSGWLDSSRSIASPRHSWCRRCGRLSRRRSRPPSVTSVRSPERIARFKAPREVHIVDALPRNATGKILKRDLRVTYTEQQPGHPLRERRPADQTPMHPTGPGRDQRRRRGQRRRTRVAAA